MNIGKILILAGFIILLAGIIIYFFNDKFTWFGKLPLDFNYKGENTQFYAPFGSMIVISIVLSLIINILMRFFK